MPFDVSEFIANIDDGAFAPVANFEVIITPPQGLRSDVDAMSLSYRSDATVIPGRRLQTKPFSAYGPPREMVVGSETSGVSVRLKCSEDLREKKFFQLWQDLAVSDARMRSAATEDMFDIRYYRDYVGTVEIYQYDVMDQVTYRCQLLEAYPQIVSDLDSSWDNDEFHRILVTFMYYRFIDEGT